MKKEGLLLFGGFVTITLLAGILVLFCAKKAKQKANLDKVVNENDSF